MDFTKWIEFDIYIAEGQELKVLPDNYEEQDKVIEADSTIKSLPRATTTTAPMDKKRKKNKQPLRKQKQQQQRKETAMPSISKQLHKQGIEIKKLKSILQSQSEVIKQLKSQSRQVTKQSSKIQKTSLAIFAIITVVSLVTASSSGIVTLAFAAKRSSDPTGSSSNKKDTSTTGIVALAQVRKESSSNVLQQYPEVVLQDLK